MQAFSKNIYKKINNPDIENPQKICLMVFGEYYPICYNECSAKNTNKKHKKETMNYGN